jgi:serralysin
MVLVLLIVAMERRLDDGGRIWPGGFSRAAWMSSLLRAKGSGGRGSSDDLQNPASPNIRERIGSGSSTLVRTGIPDTNMVGNTGNFVNQDINGLVYGSAWDTTNLTYSFPASAASYGTGYPDQSALNGFQVLSAAQQSVARYAFSLISQYTSLTFTDVPSTSTTHATIRLAGSSFPSTSYSYYPATTNDGGDVFYGNIRNDAATKAGYAFDSILHEIGHSLGLKHGQDNDGTHGVLPASHNSTEWSVMDYHSYIGGDSSYDNSAGSGNQTYMTDDISALQYLYGANFNTGAGHAIYSWSPITGQEFIDGVGQGASSTNTVYGSIWDGNGNATYDLSNYSTNLAIDLRPGDWSTFSTNQLANLDARVPGVDVAPGNIINANLYNNDPRSLIDNAYGGSGNDTLTGNSADNLLYGGAGNDILYGGGGIDTARFGGTANQYTLTLNSPGNYTIVKPDGTDQLHAIDLLQFGTSAPVAIDTLLNHDSVSLSAPGTVQETVLGAGVDLIETVTATGSLSTVYEQVLTATKAVETAYQAVSLTSGVGRFSVHLAKSGDMIHVVNNISVPAVTANSLPVTITAPAVTTQPINPGTVSVARPSSLTAGQVSFIGNVVHGSPGVVKFAWHASANGETASAHDMVTATLLANGTYTASLNIDHVGQLGYFYVAVDGVMTDEWNAVPTARALPPTIAISAPGSVQEAFPGAGVTINETVAAASLTGNVYEEVVTAAGAVETAYQAVALTNGAGSFSVHLASSGDSIRVVDNVSAPTVIANSAPVTITDPIVRPLPTGTVSVARPSSLIAGQDSFTGNVTHGSPGVVKFAWHASSTGETALMHDMVTATRQSDGTYTASLNVDHLGELGYFYVAVDGVVTDEWNATPVIGSATAAKPAFITAATQNSPPSTSAPSAPVTMHAQDMKAMLASDLFSKVVRPVSSGAANPPDPVHQAGAATFLTEQSASLFMTHPDAGHHYQ